MKMPDVNVTALLMRAQFFSLGSAVDGARQDPPLVPAHGDELRHWTGGYRGIS